MSLLTIVLPVFFIVIGLGFILRRTKLIDPPFLIKINHLVYYIGLPGLLFYKISTADFIPSFNPYLISGLFLATICTFLASFLFIHIRSYPVLNKRPLPRNLLEEILPSLGLS